MHLYAQESFSRRALFWEQGPYLFFHTFLGSSLVVDFCCQDMMRLKVERSNKYFRIIAQGRPNKHICFPQLKFIVLLKRVSTQISSEMSGC